METSLPAATRRLVLGSTGAALAIGVAALVMIPTALRGMFSTSFLPHSFCYLNNKQLIALHVGSDAVIWLSYLAISCSLVYLVWRTRREVPFSWMFLAFGLFIVACGFTHLMEVIVLWKPLYWLSGDVKLVTAAASVVTAIALPGVIPQVHRMVTSAHVSEDRRLQLERANADLQRLSVHIMSVQDAERRRIARELHDGVGQYLAAIKMSNEIALQEARQSDAAALGALQDSLNLLDHCTAEVRTMSHLLHPPLLEEMGLATAVPWYVKGFTERSGIVVDLDGPAKPDRLPQAIELVLFRVLQECLTNIHRHADAKLAKIRFRVEDNGVRLTVEDSGKGIAFVDGRPVNPGVGIASMRERVRELRGELRVSSGSTGTVVEVMVPLDKET
jgi:signal transduction histidine kinase